MNRNPLFFSVLPFAALAGCAAVSAAQGASGNLSGTVVDASGAILANATVTLISPLSGFTRSTTSDAGGRYAFYNVPFHAYQLTVTSAGFTDSTKRVDMTSAIQVVAPVQLAVAGSSTTVTVEGGSDLVENDPNMHADIDRSTIARLPLESQSSSLSSIVTLASPGVAADSNGLFHGLGDHAENSFSVDGQPITDQQSKVFSNQLPSEAVQSLTVIDGAPPAEFGDKTSLVIVATTRSGQGVTTPHGTVYGSYGTFGSSTREPTSPTGVRAGGTFSRSAA